MAQINREQQRAELHKTIWNIANDLRGSVDGWDFKQYVLGFLFYRYISENFTNYLNSNEHKSGIKDFDYAKLTDEDVKQIPENEIETIINNKGFFIWPSQLFCNVRKNAKDNENLNWIVPCNYTFMTFPYNNLLYAVYQDGMLLRLDVFDIEDGFKMLYSLETSSNEIISNRMYCIEELLCGGVDDTITELKKRLIKKDNIVNLVCFPHYTEDVFYSGSDYCPEDNYTIEDSLRDAFDDEPETMWGIRD